jgi:hypothetical protein
MMEENFCAWCGKPIPQNLENHIDFPVKYKEKVYCPTCLQQLMHNTII